MDTKHVLYLHNTRSIWAQNRSPVPVRFFLETSFHLSICLRLPVCPSKCLFVRKKRWVYARFKQKKKKKIVCRTIFTSDTHVYVVCTPQRFVAYSHITGNLTLGSQFILHAEKLPVIPRTHTRARTHLPVCSKLNRCRYNLWQVHS